ncbi:MAG: hypothetical protein PHV05_04855 [Candidatus Riflebacteria bacterium]|nr:hypothetical protein [Candidatus Riflebacteria bacterium]
MTETVNDIIERLKTKQISWWKHLKSEGWHLCPICQKRPVAKESTICAFCAELKRKGRLLRTQTPDHPTLPGISDKPQLKLVPPVRKEVPDDKQ